MGQLFHRLAARAIVREANGYTPDAIFMLGSVYCAAAANQVIENKPFS
ncbi:hypothetical protein [Salinimonas sediminis]|nr:hypothetical protein [Salinimonas sediminis]